MEDISDHVIPDLYGQVFQLLRQFSSALGIEIIFNGNPDYLLLNGMPGVE